MKSGSVKLSTVKEYNRLDAEFYLSVEAEKDLELARKHAVKTFRATGKRLLRGIWGTIKGRVRYYYWKATGQVRT